MNIYRHSTADYIPTLIIRRNVFTNLYGCRLAFKVELTE